jgi:hypothetical protein
MLQPDPSQVLHSPVLQPSINLYCDLPAAFNVDLRTPFWLLQVPVMRLRRLRAGQCPPSGDED